jgi:hypothetical protein
MIRLAPAPITVAVLIVAALVLRLEHLDQPLLNFHPTRQYRSALIARACYYDHADLPEAARAIARANRDIQPAAEPPIMEWLSCAAYLALGAEQLAVPRALAATLWVQGAVPLYAVLTSIASPAAAVVGVSTYLFAPYGVAASRAFQPDTLMSSCALWALWALMRLRAEPTTGRTFAAVATVSLATLVKPMSVFLTIPAAVAFSLAPGIAHRTSRWASMAIATSVGVVIGLTYYGYSTIVATVARDQLPLRFVPSLVGTSFFWQGLWTQIRRVFGVPVFSVMVIGTLVAASGLARTLLVSLWVGYAAFAVAFTYHMPTHDYYHLPYLALAALAVTSVYEFATTSKLWPRSTVAAAAVAAGIAALGIVLSVPTMRSTDAERVRQYEEIGALAEHSGRVLFLDHTYGYPLMYHGLVSGDAWPTTDDLYAEELGGAAAIDAHQRYARDFADYDATHFIATDLASLKAQPDLQQLLTEIATVVRQTPAYHVYRFGQHQR